VEIPLIIPEKAAGRARRGGRLWYIFGSIEKKDWPEAPGDPQATWGAVPGDPGRLARGFTRRAYCLETLSWLLLLTGIGLNVFFIVLITRFLLRI
jgi:hypothetical protein